MKIKIAMAGVVAVVALAACSKPTAAPAPKTTASPSPSPTFTADAIFMGAIRVEFPDATDEDTIRLGHKYCDMLSSGIPLKRIVDASTANPYLAGYIAGAAIVAYCPVHRDQIG